MSRYWLALCFVVLWGAAAPAQNAALVPIRHHTPGLPARGVAPAVRSTPETIQSVGSATKWAFKARESAILATPIVRLEDIVEPLDPKLAAWPRLKRVSVGLLPSDGKAMTIQRDRLSHIITTIEATPREIDWYGPTEISVRYDSSLARAIAIASYKQPPDDSVVVAQSSYAANEVVKTAPVVVLDVATRDRLRNWIELAIRRELRNATERYEIQLDDDDHALAALASANSLASIELTEPPHEGRVQLRVVGRHHQGPITAEVPLTLRSHRQVVVARMNLQRGERIGISDVTLAPLPAKQWKDSYATSLESILGMEVRGIVREGAPISMSDLSEPILVHRGDLLEIRVVGGGIVITTNAKSLGEGAEGELVEVETIEPRHRLIAKVVSPGIVEIITRAPQVRK